MRKFSFLYIYVCLTLIFVSCAQVVPLTGGDKDQQPPKLTEAIPAQGTTNLSDSRIILKFDEYIQLRDLFNQLIISPQLKEQPEINAKGKSIEIQFKEELQKETTYKLFFGNAICDITEGNAIPNFEYVFSTGSQIDSLKLNGKIIDAFTLKEQTNIQVGLYRNIQDSIPYKDKPDYISRTDKNGEFIISNIKKGNYKVVAIGDNNKNYLYDAGELIGFTEENLVLDSNKTINISLFKEETKKIFVKKAEHTTPEKVLLLLNSALSPAQSKAITSSIVIKDKNERIINDYFVKSRFNSDSIHLYFPQIPADSIYIYVNQNPDPSIVSFQTKDQLLNQFERKRFPFEIKQTTALDGLLPFYAPLVFTSGFIIDNSDASKIIITENGKAIGSLVTSQLNVSHDSIFITKQWKEEAEYKLILLPGSFKDAYERTNDSIQVSFKTNSKSDLGSLIIKLPVSDKDLIVQLYNSSFKCVYEKITSKNVNEVQFYNLKPDTYKIKFIVDANNDRAFSTGNYLNKQQAEKVFIYDKEIKIIADWENEIQIPEIK